MMIFLLICLLSFAVFLTNSTKTVTFRGLLEWQAWTECSETCGTSVRVRFRECYSDKGQDGLCPWINQMETENCEVEPCKTGQNAVENVVEKLRLSGIKDNLFLNRYAKSTTNYGESSSKLEINGYGIWRLSTSQIQQILQSKRTKKYGSDEIDFEKMIDTICNTSGSFELQVSTLEVDVLHSQIDDYPCVSLSAFLTYLQQVGMYTPDEGFPLQVESQLALLKNITGDLEIDWNTTLDVELEQIQQQCAQADIDFEFVIDSSDSVRAENWDRTMELIGEYWIKQVINPKSSKTRGNHVAGRWFSDGSERFLDFEPSQEFKQLNLTYTEFVAYYFKSRPYINGGTNTSLALEKVRTEDLLTARNGLKYVMILTDGQSNTPDQTSQQAKLLKKTENTTVFAFGVGDDINIDELNIIASGPGQVGQMTSFGDLVEYVRHFVVAQKGCETSQPQPYRTINFESTPSEIVDACSVNFTCNSINSSYYQDFIRNATVAAESTLFPIELLLGYISKMTVNEQSKNLKNWRPCIFERFRQEQCYGLMHIPESLFPNRDLVGDSVEHFENGIEKMIQLINQIEVAFPTFTPIQKTRSLFATLEAGLSSIQGKEFIDKKTTNGDFSCDIFVRAICFNIMILKS